MRDDKVSIAKAIGILLMVAGHAGMPAAGSHFIVMFHMPLFFIMAGYCFKEKYLIDSPSHTHTILGYVRIIPAFIVKRVKGLWWPYVKYSLLFLLFHNVFYEINIYNNEYGFEGKVSSLYSLKEYAERVIRIIVGMHGTEQLLGGYWFLPQLLYASIISFFTLKYIKNIYVGIIFWMIITVISSIFSIRIPFWGIRSLTFLSTVFFLVGYLYKKNFDNWNKWYCTLVFFIIVSIGSIYYCTSMLRFTSEKILPYFICAICGTVMILNISQWISAKNNNMKKLLVYIGNNTLTVLTWHFLCFKLVSFVIIKWNGLPIEQLACFPIIPQYGFCWWIYFVVGAGVPLCLNYFSDFYLKKEKFV